MALFEPMPDKYSKYFLPVILLLTAIVFANTLGNGFADNWDDDVYLFKNDVIKHLNRDNLKVIFSTFYNANYHPLTTLSYALEYHLFGLNPFPFHLTNYILHLLNVLLLYLFLKRFTCKPRVAAIASLFFAVHPMHVESVAWISERKDVLYTFFFLLSLNSYSKFLVIDKAKHTCLAWSFFWFLLSLMSKSAAVCLPAVLVLMDYYHHKKLSWQALVLKIPFFAAALLFGILAVYFQKSAGGIHGLAWFFSIPDRIILVGYSIIFYLFKVFAPFNLSALHFYPIKSGNMLPLEYYLALPVLILLIWGVLKSGRFKHELIFGLLFYFITIFMVLKIIPIGGTIVAERYSYVPYIGIFFIFGQFYSYVQDNEILPGRKIKSVVPVLLIMLAFLYSYLAYERNKVWKNGIVLFTDVIEKGRLIPEQRSADILGTGSNWMALYNFDMTLANNNLGFAYGRVKDWDNGIKYCQIALEYSPRYQLAKNNLSWMRKEKAKQQLADALKTSKMDLSETSLFKLGMAYIDIKMYKESIAVFKKVLALNPRNVNANNNLGFACGCVKDWDNGIKYCQIALGLSPDHQLAKNNLSWMKKEKAKENATGN